MKSVVGLSSYNTIKGIKKQVLHREGFTIVELLIVVVVIAILAAITIVSYNGITNQAHNVSVQADLKQIAQQVELYHATHGTLPRGAAFRDDVQTKVARGSYSDSEPLFINSGVHYNVMYCSPTTNEDTYAIVARSRSGTVYRYGTAGSGPITLSSSTSSMDLCNEAGATTTDTTDNSRQFLYFSGWVSWAD